MYYSFFKYIKKYVIIEDSSFKHDHKIPTSIIQTIFFFFFNDSSKPFQWWPAVFFGKPQLFLQEESTPVKIMWLLWVEVVKWLFCMIKIHVVG